MEELITPTPPPVPPTPIAKAWNTLHIFGFGTVQAISDTQNVQAPIAAFQAEVDAVVDDVWAGKPEGYASPKTYHAINNFNEMFSDWLPSSDAQSFRVEAANLDQTLLDALAASVLAYVPPTTTTTTTAP
jgi:hypothetical protein